jgi:curved DNA-binding protein CbpA
MLRSNNFSEIIMNYHDILGVAPNATMEEITKAYRAKAKQYHPDKTQGTKKDKEEATKNFVMIHKAYEALINPTQQNKYDNNPTDEESVSFRDLESWTSGSTGPLKFKQRRSYVVYSYSICTLNREENTFKTSDIKSSFALEPLYCSLDAFAKLVNNLNNNACTNEKYRPLATAMQMLYVGINKKIKALHQSSETFNFENTQWSGVECSLVLKTLRECQEDFKNFQEQNQALIETHRGFLRSTPVFKELFTAMDLVCNVLANTIIFIINKLGNHSIAYFGIFQAPKTNTAQEMDELSEDMRYQIDNLSRF